MRTGAIGGWMLARFMKGPGWKKMVNVRIPLVLERFASGAAGADTAAVSST